MPVEAQGVCIFAGNHQMDAVKALQIPGRHVKNPKYFHTQPEPQNRRDAKYDDRDLEWFKGRIGAQNTPYARVLILRDSWKPEILDEIAFAYKEVLDLDVEWVDPESAERKPLASMTKPELLLYAVGRNLKVDGRMGKDKIQAAIEEAEAA